MMVVAIQTTLCAIVLLAFVCGLSFAEDAGEQKASKDVASATKRGSLASEPLSSEATWRRAQFERDFNRAVDWIKRTEKKVYDDSQPLPQENCSRLKLELALMEAESTALAASGGVHATVSLREKLKGTTKYAVPFPRYPTEESLAALTLAKLPPNVAGEELKALVEQGSFLALYVLSYLPSDHALPILHDLLVRQRLEGEKRLVRYKVATLLGAIGTKESVELLTRVFKDREYAVWMNLKKKDLNTIGRMQSRLVIRDDQERADWTRQELEYWRGMETNPGFVSCADSMWSVAAVLDSRGVRFTPQYIRNRLPEPLAVAIAGTQKESSLVPDLERIGRNQGEGFLMAQHALTAIEDSKRVDHQGTSGPHGVPKNGK